MKKYLPCLFVLFCYFPGLECLAQKPADTAKIEEPLPPIRKFYVGSSMDGAILSMSSVTLNGATPSSLTEVARFSYFINWGFTFNFNLSRHFGVYTGIDLKNIGFIEHDNISGMTIKRRTYNVGAPVGVKIGNMGLKRWYFFMGGGADIPVNYKQKTYALRNQKQKFNEWFSDRTPQVMPYIFAGIAVNRGVTVKAQYYPNNFINPDFATNGTHPYAGYDVHISMLSLGISVPIKRYRPGMKIIKDKKESDTAQEHG
jgi:hypothetical protein